MIEDNDKDLNLNVNAPSLVEPQENLLDPNIEDETKKQEALNEPSVKEPTKQLKLKATSFPSLAADQTKLDVPNVLDNELIEKEKNLLDPIELKRRQKIELNNRLYEYQQSQSYEVDEKIKTAGKNLQGTSFGEVQSITDSVLLLQKAGEGTDEFLSKLSPKIRQEVEQNLLDATALEEVEIADKKPEDLDKPDYSLEAITLRGMDNITSETESVKKAWSSNYFDMANFDNWIKDNKGGSLNSLTQNPNARTQLREKFLEEYLGDKYKLYRSIYNRPLDEVEDAGNWDAVNLEKLVESELTTEEDVDAAIQVGRKEIAQILIETQAGSGSASVLNQLEALRATEAYGKNIGEQVYDLAFKELYDKLDPVHAQPYFVKEFGLKVDNELKNTLNTEDAAAFVALFEHVKPDGKLNKKGVAGKWTTPQYYLKELIDNATDAMGKKLRSEIDIKLEGFDKKEEVVSKSFDTINVVQENLYKQITALAEKDNKTEQEEKDLIDLIGKYKVNDDYLNKVNVDEIGKVYSRQAKYLNLEIDVLNSQYEKGALGEKEYLDALSKNYNGFERAWMNVDTQLLGGWSSTINRLAGVGTKAQRKNEENAQKVFADKILFSSQSKLAALEMSIADNTSSTLAGLSLLIPGFGTYVAGANFFAMSTGGSFRETEARREYEKSMLDSSNPNGYDAKIAGTTDPLKLWKLNWQKQQATNILNVSTLTENSVGISTGALEVATERIFGAFAIAKNVRAWSKVGANASLLKKTMGATLGTAISLPGEMFQETIVQTAGNFMDIEFLGRKDVGVFDGIDSQFFLDVGVGTLMMSGGVSTSNMYNGLKTRFQTREEKSLIKSKINKIADIDAQIKEIDPVEENFDKIVDLINEKDQLILDITKFDKRSFQKLEALDANQLQEISELDRKRTNALRVINENSGSGVFGENMTSRDKSILEDAKKQYNELSDQIDAIAGTETNALDIEYTRLEKEAKSKGLDPLKRKSKADFIYEMGMASFSQSVGKKLAEADGMDYTIVKPEDLTEEFYNNVKEKYGLTDKQIADFIKGAEFGEAAKFIQGNGNRGAFVFANNINRVIVEKGSLEAQLAAVSPIHEVFHNQHTKVKGFLNKDGEVTSAAKKGIIGLAALMKSKFESGEITKEVYELFESRVELYRRKPEDLDPEIKMVSLELALLDTQLKAERKDLNKKEKKALEEDLKNQRKEVEARLKALKDQRILTAVEQYEGLDDGVDHEEMVNLVNDLQSIGAIKRNDWTMLFGIKNYLNTLLSKTKYGKHFTSFINFNDANEVFSYISRFNTKALEARSMRGTVVDEELETKQKESRVSKDAFTDSEIAEDLGLTRQTKDIVETNDQVYRDIVKRAEREGMSLKEAITQRDKDKLVTNNIPRVLALANQAARAAKNLTLEENLKIKDVGEWMSEYSLKLVELANSWDPAKNDSFGAYMNQLLPKKYSGILDKLKSKVETTSADTNEVGTTAYGNVIDEGPTQDEVIDGKVKPKKAKGVTLVNDMVGLSDNIRPNESLNAIKEAQTDEQRQEAESKYQQDLLNTPLYKLVAKLNPSIKPDDVRLKPLLKNLQQGDLRPVFDMIVKEFGLDPNKVAKGATMPQGDIRTAQRFIANNFDLIIGSLPEGFDSNFKATGVQNVLLNAFYNQREVRAATKAGNKVWVKKPVNSILKDRKAAMAVFGLTEAGIPNIADKASNIAPPIQAIARWTASNITSQTIRELEANDLSPKAEAKRNALNDGKSKMLAAKVVLDMDRNDPAQGIEFRSMLPQFGAALEKINTLDKKSVRAVVEEVYGDLLTKPQITQFVTDLTKPKTGILARYDLLNKNYKEVKAELFDLKEFVEMEVVMTEAATLNQIGKILGIDVDRATLLRDAKTVNRLRKTVITGFAIELENSGLSDPDIVRFVLTMKEMYASAGNIGKAELSTNGKPGGDVSDRVGGRERRQSGQITEGNADFFALIKNGSQKVYDLMMLSDKGSVNRKKLSEKYGVSFENYSESSATVLKEIENNTFSLDGRKGQAKFNQDVTLRILEFVKNKIDEEVLSKADALVVVGAFGSSMESPSRKAAYAAYVATNADTFKNPGKDLAYDHMKPHNVMMNQVVDAVFNTKNAKKKQEKIDEAFNDYVVGIIPEAFDALITQMGMQYNMQATYDPKATGLRGVLGRLYNDRTLGGKDVVAIRSLETGDVIGEDFVRASEIIVNDAKQTEQLKKADEAIVNMRMKSSKVSRGMSTFDFDETLIIGGKNSVTATKDGKTVKISSEDFPLKGPQLAEEGYEFDFSDFANVKGGKAGPLMQKLKNQIAKYGVDNVFVLTARMQESAPAIHEWLKTQGVELKLENITGLGNSTGEAKALWMLEKFGEGYNDMYFVDDALPNVKAVKNVLDQLDIKSKVRQAIVKPSKINNDFNLMLQRTKGIGAEKVFSKVVAEKRGKNVGKFSIFVPPSAEDFAGLLRYFAGTGKQGDADIKYLEDLLIKPFNRAYLEMNEMRIGISEDYKQLRKQFPEIKKKLGKLMPNSEFTLDNAIRVYLWNKAGFDIPGLSKRDVENLVARVEVDPMTKAFADTLGLISKQDDGYIKPEANWQAETIALDLQNIVSKIGRKKFLAEWIENKNAFFTPENLNKIEAVYGTNFREALEDILYRMETGVNRSAGKSYGQGWTNWVNGSVGAIMFFNGRSAVLQTLSMVNFINFEDNNIFQAGKALANQKQYWSDFSMLFNSAFLKGRRAGLATNVNEAELANAVAGASNKAKAALAYLLKIGFTPTQIADSFAIASGGATFYRNRVNTYVKQGMDLAAAEKQAMLDFQEIAEETQQSARPDRISQQQASPLGRLILSFANTPLQYNRLIKKAANDLINGRGDWRSNVSRILYYGAAQNFIFSAMQQALFAVAFDDEDDDEILDTKTERIANGMLDSLLRGSGIAGAVLSTVKNSVIEYMEQDKKGFKADYAEVLVEAINLSPPLGSKARKLYSAGKARKFNKDIMKSMNTFDYDNPMWEAVGNVTSALTNIPLDRLIRKTDNVREALNQDNTALQRTFLMLGWDTWSLKVGEKKIVNKGKENEYVKYLPLKQQAQEEAEEALKKSKKKNKGRFGGGRFN